MLINHRKSLIQHYESILNGQKLEKAKNVQFGEFSKNCSILMGQKLVENAKIDNSNETFVAIFQQCANAGNIHWNFFEL